MDSKVIKQIKKDNFVINFVNQDLSYLKSDQFYKAYANILIKQSKINT